MSATLANLVLGLIEFAAYVLCTYFTYRQYRASKSPWVKFAALGFLFIAAGAASVLYSIWVSFSTGFDIPAWIHAFDSGYLIGGVLLYAALSG